MLMLGMLRLLLLAGTCLGVYGDPVRLLDVNADQDSDCGGRCAGAETTVGLSRTDVRSELLDGEHATGLVLNISAGGWPDPHGQPEGAASTGPSLPVDPEGEKEVVPVTGEPMLSSSAGRNKLDVAVSNAKFPPGGFLSPTPSTPIDMTVRQRKVKGDEHQVKRPGYGDSLQDKDPETRSPPSAEPPYTGVWIGKVTFSSPIPPSVSISPRISTPIPMWGRDGATTSALPDPLLPEIEPKLMPREDGPENLWTEAVRPGGVDTVVPLAQDDATEGTMSSEALPLIFEPFEEAAPEGPPAATPVPSSAQTPAATALSEADLDQLDAMETDGDGPSNAPPLLVPDWTSPWQTSGGTVRTPNLKENSPSAGTPTPSFTRAKTTIKTSSRQPMHDSRSGSEEMESEEEPDEDDDDENSEEDESEEDLTEIPKASSTQPPYSLIPPPPVWVQRNQGLMRSWVELIREKAGYVSGMLAPVGIGITGALLIVGVLYSIRMIHRKRRNNFKHQRRKVRQPEQPGEPAIRRQDQAMLLADSSEDEF